MEEPRGGGFAGAINCGIRRASTDRIGFLLSDDWLESRAVELCLAHDTDIVSTGHTEYLADGVTKLPDVSRPRRKGVFDRLYTLEEKARYLKHFFLFRKAKLLEVGGLDESLGDLPGIDDYDLIWTLLEHDAGVAIVETSLYNYRDHDGERLTLRDAGQATAHDGKDSRQARPRRRGESSGCSRCMRRGTVAPYTWYRRRLARHRSGRRVRVATDASAFVERGFRRREFFAHEVVWFPKPYPDTMLKLDVRGVARARVTGGPLRSGERVLLAARRPPRGAVHRPRRELAWAAVRQTRTDRRRGLVRRRTARRS